MLLPGGSKSHLSFAVQVLSSWLCLFYFLLIVLLSCIKHIKRIHAFYRQRNLMWFANISCTCSLLCGGGLMERKRKHFFAPHFRALKLWNIIKLLIKSEVEPSKATVGTWTCISKLLGPNLCWSHTAPLLFSKSQITGFIKWIFCTMNREPWEVK